MATANPWDPASAPKAAGLLLGNFVASGTVTQEILNISKKTASCFMNFSRQQQITDIQAEIYQKNLEIELLKLAKDTEDVVHPFFLAQKCHTLQSMNNHLETVLKEKRSLRQRLLKPMCQENLPIEAVYQSDLKSQALAKMDVLVTETEELAENILKWRKQQKEVSSCIPKLLAEENVLHKHDIITSPSPSTSKVHAQTINAK
ncbi:HAUS augmin-like complex subunit 2 [Otolemur garnettii]|uniref:HAUS augmin-like complex subunit 2 n=1 Tax=Otolemur garnettii TaxID=30611 RepID=UPI000C7F4B62|nr:HAUS augmin-like complex subunit 2 [Otolemur garnettii]